MRFPPLHSTYFDFSRIVDEVGHASVFLSDEMAKKVGLFSYDGVGIQIRNIGNLRTKSFFLSKHYNWEIVSDNSGQKVLLVKNKDGSKLSFDYLESLLCYPEVFFDVKKRNGEALRGSFNADFPASLIQIRGIGHLKNRGFYLANSLNWEIIVDNCNVSCLVPTRQR